MEEGYLPDRSHGFTYVTRWFRGVPAMGMFGIKGFRFGEAKCIPVTTYRCPECGWLKSYAKSASQTAER